MHKSVGSSHYRKPAVDLKIGQTSIFSLPISADDDVTAQVMGSAEKKPGLWHVQFYVHVDQLVTVAVGAINLRKKSFQWILVLPYGAWQKTKP
jgi:hypothetical protein